MTRSKQIPCIWDEWQEPFLASTDYVEVCFKAHFLHVSDRKKKQREELYTEQKVWSKKKNAKKRIQSSKPSKFLKEGSKL